MIYLQRHSKPFNWGNTFIWLIPVLIIVLLLGLSITVQSFFMNLFKPVFNFGGKFYSSISEIPTNFENKKSLIDEVNNLESKVFDLELNQADYEAIRFENNKLRSDLGLKPLTDNISASVIARPPQTTFDTIIVDRGSSDGVKVDDIVLASERVFIGKVAKVLDKTSVIELNSSANQTLSGIVLRTNDPIEISGSGGGNMVSKVPIDYDILLQDKVMVQTKYSYEVAVVESIEEDKSSGYKSILLSLPINISKISVVFIVK